MFLKSKTEFSDKGINHWPEDERPREKLLKFGEHTLSNSELIAILLRVGIKGQSAVDLGRKILNTFGSFRNMGQTDLRAWNGIKGLGAAKIAQLRAAIEIGRRFMEEDKKISGKIGGSKEVAELFMPRMRDLKNEVFKILLLNSKNHILETIEMTEGTVNQASPIIREIISKALQHFAAGLICLHNHPSGDAAPSREDRVFTQNLAEAGRIMQIRILDHIIIGDDQYYSFSDHGEMQERKFPAQ